MPSLSSPPAGETPQNDPSAALLARLRAEFAARPEGSAVLSHEIGAIEERGGDEAGAARDYLAAYNADPQFREPLEALVRVLDRRKSIKNLGKLLEALVRSGETPEERARALVEWAAFCGEHLQDAAAARGALEEAVAERPDDATAWLELQVSGGKSEDPEVVARSIEARAGLADDGVWRGALLCALADVEARRGEVDRAFAALERAVAIGGGARWRALGAIELLARREGRDDVLGRALGHIADLVAGAVELPETADDVGVPRWARTPAIATEALLRAADARLRAGDAAGACDALDRACRIAPTDPVVLHARLGAAETQGDAATIGRVARELLARSATTGSSAASLWLQLAEASATLEDPAGTLAAVRGALEADPRSVPARALLGDLLARTGDAAALGAALEAAGSDLPTDAGKGRANLLAAWVHANDARDVGAAKAALTQAAMFGVAPGIVARVARTLAMLCGDTAWYEDATRKLSSAGAHEGEASSLWFELGRARAARGDDAGAAKAFEALANAPGGSWLGRALGAWALPAGERAPESLEALAAVEPDAETARGITIAAARRWNDRGNSGRSRELLGELHSRDAEDLVSAVFLADLERAAGRPRDAALVLGAAAAATTDPDAATALALEGALVLWRAGESKAALAELEAVRSRTPGAAALFAWAARGVEPDAPESRRRAIDAALAAGEDEAASALERFALEAVAGKDLEAADEALGSVERGADGAFAAAGALGRVVWRGEAVDRRALDDALDRLERLGGGAATLARAERFRLAREDGDDVAAEPWARRWCESGGGLPAAIEWLAASMATANGAAEADARGAVARALEGEARSAVEASAAAVRLVHAPGRPQPLLSPDSVAARLMNLELAPLGCDPRRRAIALRGIDDALGEGPAVTAPWDALVLAGWNDLCAGDAAGALHAFEAVARARPDDAFAWDGVRAAAHAASDTPRLAEACARLGDLDTDDAQGAVRWEEAALLWLDYLGEPERGEHALERAFSRDPTRKLAFDRLFRRVRERAEGDRLLDLIARRLLVADEHVEIAKLYWERARVLRQKGERDRALEALEHVTLIDPDHVGALALAGEIHITQGRFREAASRLERLAALDQAPAQQRLISGVASGDLYENKLDEPARALDVLVALHRAGLATLPVRERLARLAARTQAWTHATAVLEELMRERPTAEGRIEAARLAMAIWRDRIHEPETAHRAVAKLLEEAPGDPEGIDFVLETELENGLRSRLLARGQDAVVAALDRDPLDDRKVALLSRVAKAVGNAPLRQATLGALVVQGRGDEATDRELAELDERVARTPQIAIDAAAVARIGDPADSGPIADLFALIAESLAEALGPSLAALGVGKRERVDPRAGLPLRNEIAAWAGALGIGDFDLYMGGADAHGVNAVPGETPALVVGARVSAPLAPATRQAVARELFALRRGISILRHRDETTVAAIVVAACQIAEVPVQAPPYAVLAEVQRQLGRAVSRRTKAALRDMGPAIASSAGDAQAWSRAALGSMDRMAAIAAGDVSLVVAEALGKPRAALGPAARESARARDVLRFVLSPRYLELRGSLGMGVK